MQTALPNQQPNESGRVPSECRTQHQTWAANLAQSEREIDQLLSLLAELPNINYRSLRNRTIDYAQTLNRLKHRIHRLRIDVACQSDRCMLTSAATCPDPRFMLCSMGGTLISGVSTEYDRVKTQCHVFLGELMGLNLI